MKNLTRFWGIIVIWAVITPVFGLSLAGCATNVPIKSVRMPTIIGMDAVKNLAISNFENRSGARSTVATQITQYLTDKVRSTIPATGKFNIVATTDPNADGVFFGELRSIVSEDSQRQSSRKDKNGNTVITTTYMRKVSVSFVYGVRNSRTDMEFGQISKQGSTSSSGPEYSALADPLAMAKRIVDSQMMSLQQDIVPTVVSTNRTLMEETLKDKTVKQQMKAVKGLVKVGAYDEAIRQYDEIGEIYGSVAARTNAGILRQVLDSDAAVSAQMARLDSERSGLTDKAVKDAVGVLHSRLPSGTVIMLIKTNSTERAMLNDVVDRITMAVIQAGNLKLVDRSNQAIIEAEQQFQLSGNVDDDSAVWIGHQLGAKYAVLCWISGVSSSRKLNLRILSIETGQITEQTSFDI
jgi:hypothetical protein